MAQVLVDNKLMKPAQTAGAELLVAGNKNPSQSSCEGQNGKRRGSHVTLDSKIDNKMVATSKRRRSSDLAKIGINLCEQLNTKWDREGDLWTKLDDRRAIATIKVAPTGSVVRTIRNKQREAVPRYQTPFS